MVAIGQWKCSMKKTHSLCTPGLITYWQEVLSYFQCTPPTSENQCKSISNGSSLPSQLLYWKGKRDWDLSLNCCTNFGVAGLGDVLDVDSQRLKLKYSLKKTKAYHFFCSNFNYGFIWQKLQSILLLQGSLPMQTNECCCKLNWCLNDKNIF